MGSCIVAATTKEAIQNVIANQVHLVLLLATAILLFVNCLSSSYETLVFVDQAERMDPLTSPFRHVLIVSLLHAPVFFSR